MTSDDPNIRRRLGLGWTPVPGIEFMISDGEVCIRGEQVGGGLCRHRKSNRQRKVGSTRVIEGLSMMKVTSYIIDRGRRHDHSRGREY